MQLVPLPGEVGVAIVRGSSVRRSGRLRFAGRHLHADPLALLTVVLLRFLLSVGWVARRRMERCGEGLFLTVPKTGGY